LGRDVAGVAQTGYAKTNAFGLSYSARMLSIVTEVDVPSWLTVVLGERGTNQAGKRLM
jgi:superfamily II DNA/RNA helicase